MGFKGRFAAEKQENPRMRQVRARAVETRFLLANGSQMERVFGRGKGHARHADRTK
jgi:hypothetical protein